MSKPPPCAGLGPQCRELPITIHIADLEEDGPTFHDAAATWLLGHTERIHMGKPYVLGTDMLVDAVIRIPCKYLSLQEPDVDGGGADGATGRSARCTAHGFTAFPPHRPAPHPNGTQERQLRNGKYVVVFKGQQRSLPLPLKRAAQRALPVVQGSNPCVGAPCRTADNRRGAACCRDLTLDVVVHESETMLERLLRARKPPYLCKVKRTSPDLVECEVISACAYLADDGISCALHNRLLPNGRPAKPSICSEWPDLEPDDTGHPGCVLLKD
jgi:hypothetical protein